MSGIPETRECAFCGAPIRDGNGWMEVRVIGRSGQLALELHFASWNCAARYIKEEEEASGVA